MMKNILIIALIFLASCNSNKQQTELKVMTYNIRLDVKSDAENQWANRKDFLLSQIKFYEPTVFGTQEGRPNQIEDLTNGLKNYNYIGHGRDGANKGEYSAIFYDKTKVKFSNVNTFWLSETPEKMSLGWDASYPRICTYGLMTVLNSDEKIWVFNTHLDHKGAEAQLKGMELIETEIKKVNTQNYPVILTGDFNVEPNSKLISKLKANFNDTKELANTNVFGSDGTFNGFKFHEPITRRIDYIMISKNANLEIKKYAVLTDSKDLKYPSDHFPVFVQIQLN
ncbi:endonuclease/exonuclease/phosphatase family protein [Polaribacter aestuariivivens]|uniref:Endonuclease/exonuclease/phosphatase family protein n=1 Tax=Polaribacter aestuariivivens TaxID=2304626 RepID=A0A5S3N2U2_9FLAO|nr:endonuclease/exonuclease/phosphatase family protein [Polaribacter aestuariivivens]TMM29570.1 endonuclease/exonuclease/phosphatase family protein [Polaribacter aestuariivivens]